MGKKKYTTEIQDAFENQIDSKQALRLAKKIKSLQKNAYPSEQYKTSLKDRLRNIYIIDQDQDIPGKFSFFQLFGVFTSFIFLIGVGFTMFHLREDSQEPVPHNIQIEKKLKFSEDSSVIKEIESYDPIQDENQEIQNIQVEGMSDISGLNQAESSMLQDGYYEDSKAIYELKLDEFYRICKEQGGVISEDDFECLLPNGEVCNQMNISELSSIPCEAIYGKIDTKHDIEINLQELIDEYSQ